MNLKLFLNTTSPLVVVIFLYMSYLMYLNCAIIDMITTTSPIMI